MIPSAPAAAAPSFCGGRRAFRKGHGPLDRAAHSGVDIPERIARRDQTELRRTVIGRPENPHVERCRVGKQPAGFQVGLIGHHHCGVKLSYGDVTSVAEFSETVQGGGVGL